MQKQGNIPLNCSFPAGYVIWCNEFSDVKGEYENLY